MGGDDESNRVAVVLIAAARKPRSTQTASPWALGKRVWFFNLSTAYTLEVGLVQERDAQQRRNLKADD